MLSAGVRKSRIGLVAASHLLVLASLVVMATGCAPDSLNNRQATGFNGYLNTLAGSCRPLVIGSSDVGDWLMNRGGSSDPNYPYFIDMTSRLYYGTISADAYRDGLNGFLGPGTTNSQAFACIFANLPGQQPTGGAGM